MLEDAPVCAYTCCRAMRSMLPLAESSLEGLAAICSYISGYAARNAPTCTSTSRLRIGVCRRLFAAGSQSTSSGE